MEPDFVKSDVESSPSDKHTGNIYFDGENSAIAWLSILQAQNHITSY